MTGKGIAALLALLGVCLTGPAPTGAAVKLGAENSVADSGFGCAVGISGDHALVGAYRDLKGTAVRSGAAYAYRRENGAWEPAEKLTAPDGAENDLFGHAVAVSGDWALVGAPHHHGPRFGSGAAYLFQRRTDGWSLSKKLTAGDGDRNDIFGYSVALSGDVAVVGAYGAGDGGAAYAFVRDGSGWYQEAALTASDGNAGDDFGRTVAVSGDRIIIGALHHDHHGAQSGAAYVFRREGSRWIEEAELLPSDGGPGDFFGFSVSISGDWALVGAPADDDQGTDAGAAYLFRRNGTVWSPYTKLLPSGESGDFFGRSVALSGNWAMVGADGTDKWGSDSGAAYIYEKTADGWHQAAQLTPEDGRTGDRIGWSVAADDTQPLGRFLAGARNSTPGAAYLHSQGQDAPHIEISPTSLTLYQVSSPASALTDRADDRRDRLADASASGIIVPEAVRQYWANRMIPPSKPLAAVLPAAVDWRKYDSPVRTQGGCGACWAFAAVALVENLVNQEGIVGAGDLSEQTVLACGEGGCRGGWYWDALSYISRKGIPSEGCHPYDARDDNCMSRCVQPNYLIKVREHTSAMGMWGKDHSVDDMKVALHNGPLIVYMLVPDDGTFEGSGYQGGVYDYNGGTISSYQGHAVLVVGYNDRDGCFVVKNSWGDWWGEGGYFRIAYDDVTDDVQFGSYAVSASGVYKEGAGGFVTVSNTGTTDLEIEDIRSNRSWLGFSPSQFSPIAPGIQKSLNIFVSDWNGVGDGYGNTGEITIYSNDPYQAAFSISVTAAALPGGGWADGPDTGDLNNDDVVDLADVVTALKILSGVEVRPLYELRPDFEAADVDGDIRVGLAEAVYGLTRASR